MVVFMLCFLAMAPAVDSGWQIHVSDLFQVMRPNEVLVRPNGEVYILHFDEGLILYYGADGQLKRRIGGKGQGPGEFTYPTYVCLREDGLYVFDQLDGQISCFDLEGKFLRRYQAPNRNLNLARAKGGWVYWASGFGVKSSQLFWAAGDFESPTVLLDIEDVGWGSGTQANSTDGQTKVTFSPLNARPNLAVSPDGKRCYFSDAQKFEILVFDGSSGKRLYQISRGEKRIPFDTEWADEQYERNAAPPGSRPNNVTIEKLYPEFFPAIRGLSFDPDGNLVVDRWRGRPDEKHYLVAFDAAGQETPLKYSWDVLRRFAGVAQGQAYITLFNEDDGAGLARVPLAEVDAFIAANPITDWSFSRSISITN